MCLMLVLGLSSAMGEERGLIFSIHHFLPLGFAILFSVFDFYRWLLSVYSADSIYLKMILRTFV